MFIAYDVKQKIEKALPGAVAEVLDKSQYHLAQSGSKGAHLKVTVKYKGFIEKTIVEQHQMIYAILKEEMKDKILELALTTKVM